LRQTTDGAAGTYMSHLLIIANVTFACRISS
jgi:hypothetical protein